MSKKRFRHNYDCPKTKADRTTPKGKDMTVPDMSYTVRELMQRRVIGTMPGVGKIPIWDEHPDFDSWDATKMEFDLADAEEMARTLQERHNQIEQKRTELKKNESNKIKAKLAELELVKKQLKEFTEGTKLKNITKDLTSEK